MGSIKGLAGLLTGIIFFSFSASFAQDVVTSGEATKEVDQTKTQSTASANPDLGRQYFEGSKRFKKGGPACISCHNVNHQDLFPGGVLAKDLTDVYDRMGDGIKDWLVAPPFAPMASSYQDHPLTEGERVALTAFFKDASVNKDKTVESSASIYFVVGGISGLLFILIIINILWWKRKKEMVKRDIFARQNRAWDAKH